MIENEPSNNNPQAETQAERQFAEAAAARFRSSVEELPGDVLDRLRQARAFALASSQASDA
jgi:hypothetical protein